MGCSWFREHCIQHRVNVVLIDFYLKSFVMVAAQTIVVRKRRIDEFSEHAKVDDYLKSELSALPGTRPAAAKHSKDDILKLRKTS